MCLFEYDEKKAMEAEREEGEAKERENTIKIMLNHEKKQMEIICIDRYTMHIISPTHATPK